SEQLIRNNITDFLRRNCNGNLILLVNTSKLLCEYPNCIPGGSDQITFCDILITNVARLPTPTPSSPSFQLDLAQLVQQMGHIDALLIKMWTDESETQNEELVFRCLTVLHGALIESPSEPCPALAAIIQLVDPALITKAVRAILRNDQGHSSTLKTLCEWTLFWPRSSNLKSWVLAMMDGLEAERQFDILMEVTLATVDRLFMTLQLPAVRPRMMYIVWRMLASSRQTSQVFLKVVNKVPIVVTQLLREKSESSEECLQMIVNMCYTMMSAFPRNDNVYDPVMQVMKDCTAFHPPELFTPENTPNWCEGVELEYLGNRERSVTNRVGLNNLGNTCYMNSVLQALFMTQRFCSNVLEAETHFQPLLNELQVLFALLLRSRRRAISPIKLLPVARPPGFQPGHQQDSSEFLIGGRGGGGDEKSDEEAMETEANGVMTRWTTEEDLSNQNILQRKARSLADFTQGDDHQNLSNSHSNSTDSGIQSVCGDENAASASSPVPYESIVQQAFGGRILTSFKCLQCQAESVHTDHFRDIQLAFPPGCSPTQELHIQELLDYFILPEHLSGENQYRCDSCVGLRDAQRSIKILQFPSHLVLTLKQFQFNSKTGQRAKLLHRVQCSENIELHNQPYKLYAAVVHSGSSMDTGHYYTLARDQSLAWHIFNDSTVAPCNPPPWNIPDTPYILFYTRPEEQLQPAVDITMLPSLRPHLMELVNQDHVQWLQDLQGEEEGRRKRRKQQQSPNVRSTYNPDKNNDSGRDPPGSCGGGGLSLPQNRFVF
ncbi:hypothetical protein C0J52_17694, partial [Blattella germanica]